MFQLTGKPLTFSAHFTKAGVSFNPAAVTVSVSRRRNDTGAAELLALGDSAELLGFGVYGYRQTNTAIAGTYFAVFTSSDDTVDRVSLTSTWYVGEDWLQQIYSRTAMISGAVAETVEEVPTVFGDALSAYSSVLFEKQIELQGKISSGWTAFSFTLKRNLGDDDSAALLTVLISNPANPGSDGLIVYNGRTTAEGTAIRDSSSIEVIETDPNTIVALRVGALGMELPPSLDGSPYAYEINLWVSDKEKLAQGEFNLIQSVRKSTETPSAI
jgi:hypothetical protein